MYEVSFKHDVLNVRRLEMTFGRGHRHGRVLGRRAESPER